MNHAYMSGPTTTITFPPGMFTSLKYDEKVTITRGMSGSKLETKEVPVSKFLEALGFTKVVITKEFFDSL